MTTSVELHAPTPPPRAGFVHYVGLHDDPDGGPTGARELAEVAEVAATLRDLARELMPTAETFTALSLIPQRAGPDDVRTLRDRLADLHPLEHDAIPVRPDPADRPARLRQHSLTADDETPGAPRAGGLAMVALRRPGAPRRRATACR